MRALRGGDEEEKEEEGEEEEEDVSPCSTSTALYHSSLTSPRTMTMIIMTAQR